MTTTRSDPAAYIAGALCAIDLGHPVRVAVDGVTASGKSTLAAAITEAVKGLGRPAIHLTMDGFHHPRARRHRQGRLSADGYYEDAYDFDALVANVLAPLGPGGSGRYRDSIIDLATDLATDAQPTAAPVDAILVIDGTFLHREPLLYRAPPQHHGTSPGYWDRTVFVDNDFDTARARGIERDRDMLGGPAKAAEAFDLRYHAASRRYLDEVDPRALASFVVDTALGTVIE